MKLSETELTPELAARLLSTVHPRQRRSSRQKVAQYARAIHEDRWRLIPDAILVDAEGRMFNGAHRCQAVIEARRSIPIYIDWDADPDLFDVIDVGRYRSPYQFIAEKDATARASAARVVLWYGHRFDRPLQPRHIGFDVHEILTEADRLSEAFDAVTGAHRAIYEYTSIAKSVAMGAFAIAYEMGYREAIESFVEGVRDPGGLDAEDPVRLLAERFRRQEHRGHRRELVDDWTLLVYAFNLHLEGRLIGKLALSSVWPAVGESTADYRRRQDSESKRRRKLGAESAAKSARRAS